MDNVQIWKNTFTNWPEKLPRRGVLVTSFGEQIPFVKFETSPDLLLLDRTTPDTMGTRQILVGYEEVHAIKITDVVQPKLFRGLGFGRETANGKSTAGSKLASGVGSGR